MRRGRRRVGSAGRRPRGRARIPLAAGRPRRSVRSTADLGISVAQSALHVVADGEQVSVNRHRTVLVGHTLVVVGGDIGASAGVRDESVVARGQRLEVGQHVGQRSVDVEGLDAVFEFVGGRRPRFPRLVDVAQVEGCVSGTSSRDSYIRDWSGTRLAGGTGGTRPLSRARVDVAVIPQKCFAAVR